MATNKKNQKPENPLKKVAALSGIAIQMGVTIYVFVLLGKWLDQSYNPSGKLFLIIFTLVGVSLSLYVVLRQVNKLNP